MVDTGEGYAVRLGRRDDAPETARLWMQSAEEHTAYDEVYRTSPQAERTMRRFLADLASGGHAFLFVAVAPERAAEGGERVIGFLSGELHVASESQDRGVGRALLAEVERRCSERGISYIEAQIIAESVTFFLSAGYEPEPDLQVLSRSIAFSD
jgi:GNAT superfamily N-acetyltransferase